MLLYEYNNFLSKVKVSGIQENAARLLKEIETARLNGLLELHIAGEDFSVDARALILKGLLVVVNAFTAFNNFYGYQAVKLLRMISLDEERVKYWIEFKVLRHEEIMAELEEMDSEAILDIPIRPVELII